MPALVAVIVAMLLALSATGCQSERKPGPTVPEGFDVPKGIQLTESGSTLPIGEPSTVVYQIEQRAASAVTITVTKVVKGDLENDFKFFNLPPEVQDALPLYVHLHVRNEGPSGLGGVALPVLLRTSAKSVLPPNDLVGDFRPCPKAALPTSFLAGSRADVCLVFLVPKGQTARTIDIQPGDAPDAIHYELANA